MENFYDCRIDFYDINGAELKLGEIYGHRQKLSSFPFLNIMFRKQKPIIVNEQYENMDCKFFGIYRVILNSISVDTLKCIIEKKGKLLNAFVAAELLEACYFLCMENKEIENVIWETMEYIICNNDNVIERELKYKVLLDSVDEHPLEEEFKKTITTLLPKNLQFGKFNVLGKYGEKVEYFDMKYGGVEFIARLNINNQHLEFITKSGEKQLITRIKYNIFVYHSQDKEQLFKYEYSHPVNILPHQKITLFEKYIGPDNRFRKIENYRWLLIVNFYD